MKEGALEFESSLQNLLKLFAEFGGHKWRREKAEAELKKKRSLQKQASIMERFLKRSKIIPSSPSSEKDSVHAQ